MAERVGFEPTLLIVDRFSRATPSTTRTSLHNVKLYLEHPYLGKQKGSILEHLVGMEESVTISAENSKESVVEISFEFI